MILKERKIKKRTCLEFSTLHVMNETNSRRLNEQNKRFLNKTFSKIRIEIMKYYCV